MRTYVKLVKRKLFKELFPFFFKGENTITENEYLQIVLVGHSQFYHGYSLLKNFDKFLEMQRLNYFSLLSLFYILECR